MHLMSENYLILFLNQQFRLTSHGADGRMRKDYGGNEVVVLANELEIGIGRQRGVKETMRQLPAGRDGHGRQLGTPTNVAQRVNA